MENFIVTLSLLLAGMGLRRLPQFPAETGNVLNLFVIYISLPALVLLKVPDLVLSGNLLVPLLMPWAMLLFSAALILLAARWLSWDRPTTGCLLLVVPLGNTSFLGIPLVQAFFGDSGIPYALLYDQLGSFLALATYGSLILALYSTTGIKPSVPTVIKKVVTFPAFIALVAAFLLRGVDYPAAISSLLNMAAATLVPVVLVAVGFQLQLKLNQSLAGQVSIGLGIKLIIAPLAALLFCQALGLEGEAVRVSIFEAGMPPMVSAGAMAILANLAPRLAAALVGLGIVLCFATLPGLYQLL